MERRNSPVNNGLDPRWFRRREEHDRDRLLEQQEHDRRRQELEQRLEAQAKAELHRQQRDERWAHYALDPANVDSEESDTVVRRLVDVAVEQGLQPWRRHQEAERVIEPAVDRLPPGAKGYNPTRWQLRAAQVAREAVRKLGPDLVMFPSAWWAPPITSYRLPGML